MVLFLKLRDKNDIDVCRWWNDEVAEGPNTRAERRDAEEKGNRDVREKSIQKGPGQ